MAKPQAVRVAVVARKAKSEMSFVMGFSEGLSMSALKRPS
jgi:hypothetical protein